MTLLPSNFFKPSITTFDKYFPPHNLYEKPYRCLLMSDSVLMDTGYGTATRALANYLHSSNDFSAIQLAYNYPGRILMPPIELIGGDIINFPVIGAGSQPYCQDTLEFWIKNLNIDIFWVFYC